MPDNDKVRETFWIEEDNPFECKRWLEVEVDRLEQENTELKALLQQARIDRDTYHQNCMLHERSNAILVKMYGKR